MSRGILQDFIQDPSGNAVVGASVEVFIADGLYTTQAALWDSAVGGNSVANPMTTVDRGYFSAYADTAEYDLRVTTTGGTFDIPNVPVFDADELTDLSGSVATAVQAAADAEAALNTFNTTLGANNDETVDVTIGQTVVTTPFTYVVGVNAIAVYLNGSKLETAAYTETNSTTITLTNPAASNGRLNFRRLRYLSVGFTGAENVDYEGQTVKEALDERLVTVATLAELLAVSNPTGGDIRRVTSYFNGYAAYAAHPFGGGDFVFSAASPKTTHDGGSVISPTVPFSGVTGAGHVDFLNGVGETDGAGVGCWVRVNTGGVRVSHYGAWPDETVDSTQAIRNAVARTVVTGFEDNGQPCSVYFDHGTYKVTDNIPIAGALALFGDGAPMSISGTRIRQHTANKSIFEVIGATNAAIYMKGLNLVDISGVADTTVGLFKVDSTTSSGNSFYFRDCWFTTPSYYAINIDAPSDDLQIQGCTFDVTAQRFIKLGSVSSALSNISIVDNTFYAGTTGGGFIDVINVSSGVINDNRFYTGGAFTVPYAASFPNALSSDVTVSDNTCVGINTLVSTQSSNITITDNRGSGFVVPIAIGGGVGVSGLVINGNGLSGTSGASGLIDATGTPLTNSVITDNALNGNSGSALALNLGAAYYASNTIGNNSVTGCTADGANVGKYLFGDWTPAFIGTGTAGTYGYSTQIGKYTKIGREVTVHFNLTLSSITAGSGELQVNGLPFPAASLSSFGSVILSSVTFPASTTMCTASVDSGGSVIRFIFSGSATGVNVVAPTALTSTSTISGQITYLAAE